MERDYFIGIDSRMSDDGCLYPWRMALADKDRVLDIIQVRLPSGQKWLNVPRHPLYGDLTYEGVSIEDGIERLGAKIPHGNNQVHLHKRHDRALLDRLLIWHGMRRTYHNVTIIEADPLRIGGEAGHEVGSVITYQNLQRMS